MIVPGICESLPHHYHICHVISLISLRTPCLDTLSGRPCLGPWTRAHGLRPKAEWGHVPLAQPFWFRKEAAQESSCVHAHIRKVAFQILGLVGTAA